MKLNLLYAISGALLLSSCSVQKGMEYKGYEDFTVSNVLKEPRVDVDLKLYNPNPIGVTIKNIELHVIVDEKPLGVVALDDKVRVKRRSEFDLPISFTTDIGQMGSILSSGLMAFLGDDTVPLGLSGSITVQKFLIFRKTFAFDYSDGLKAREIKQK